MTETTQAKKIADLMMAIAEPTRLRILYLLVHQPLNVGQLATSVGVPMVNMSHHLGVMRQNGLLEDDKQGRHVIYRVRSDIFEPATDGAASESLGTLIFGHYRITLRHTSRPAQKNGTRKKRDDGDS